MNFKIIGAAIAAVVLLIAVLVALAFAGILPNPLIGLFLDPPEHSARYYPRDTIAYGWLSLYPEGGQRDQMVDLWDRFNELDEVEEQIEELREEMEDELNVNLEDDVLPWVGPELSLGLLEDSGDPVGVMTISVRDRGEAEDFMDDFTDHLEDEQGYDFDTDEKDSALTWVDEHDSLGLALADDVLIAVFGNEPGDSLDDVLEVVSGEESRSLADEESFQAARAMLSDRRFASAYVNVNDAINAWEDSYLYGLEMDDVNSLAESTDIPEWAAVSAQWIDRGIVIEGLSPNTVDFIRSLEKLDNPAKLVSGGTVALLAVSFDPDLDNLREELEDFESEGDNFFVYELYDQLYWEVERESDFPPRRKDNPDMADVLDLFLELMEANTGVDLEEDLLAYLEGSLVLAVEEFDVDTIEEDPLGEAVNVAAMLSYRDDEEDSLQDTLEDLSEIVEDELSLDIDSIDVGADNEAEIFRTDSLGMDTGYEPGYVLHNGQLVFGTTQESLENVVAAQKGEIEDLASSGEYKRAIDGLPSDQQFLFWISLQQIVGEMKAEDLDLTEDEFEAVEASLGSVAASGFADEEILRANLVITFFPE